jgi:uncharacterized coiled-coil DUF342 family protein
VALSSFQAAFQGAMTVKMETERQTHLDRSLRIKEVLIQIEALKTAVEDIKTNLDASAQQSAESMKKLIASLSGAFDTNARVMANFTS